MAKKTAIIGSLKVGAIFRFKKGRAVCSVTNVTEDTVHYTGARRHFVAWEGSFDYLSEVEVLRS